MGGMTFDLCLTLYNSSFILYVQLFLGSLFCVSSNIVCLSLCTLIRELTILLFLMSGRSDNFILLYFIKSILESFLLFERKITD